ncbi:MAG: hypothetical protein ACKVXR_12490 [Planctomycetota bacterium]
MQTPLENRTSPRRTAADPRDLARRVVVGASAVAGLTGILSGLPLLAVLLRAGAVCCAGILLITAAESIVRRTRRRVIR